MKPRSKFRLGPAVMVTAAFVGPGTVMTASRAGADFGFALLWTIVFSVITAIVLQEMAARLGIVTKQGLAASIGASISNAGIRYAAITLILGAILFGNSAYQTGNLLGAAGGMQVLTGMDSKWWVSIIGCVAAGIVLIGRFAVLQWVLTILVAFMGVIFVASAVCCRPDIGEIFAGLQFAAPAGSGWVIVGLIGTTVVPYNLFLHANAAAQRYGDSNDLPRSLLHSFFDTIISIVIGGVITAALMITAAVTFADGQELTNVKDIAQQLRPSLGPWAERCFAIGLFAAGLTSSITAPIAAAYATAGCAGWEAKLSNWKMRLIALGVIAIGMVFAIRYGGSPSETIIVAQAANGLLLPIVAVFLLYAVSREKLLGVYSNGIVRNTIGAGVVLVTAILAARQLISVWKKLIELFANSA